MGDWQDFLQKVKSANDIVDVIGSYIDVRQRGNSFWARCPFHGEKTPSFSVSKKGFFKCFGCGESGDVITFVQKYESCTFYEAVEILAKRVNLDMPKLADSHNQQDAEQKLRTKDKQYQLLREVGLYYVSSYHSAIGHKARQYMQGRGFSQDTIKAFGIGYSPNMVGLVQHLQGKGCDLDMAVTLGILGRNSSGKYYDAMSGRLVVPIINIYKKVIAFGGRALDDDTAKYGKYKNTSDSPIFIKTNNLYAINMAKHAKQQANLPYAIMVEGYMDVIAMYQAGYSQCVASMGTSLTAPQAKLLSRLVDKVYICYDGDNAGQKATIRGLDILQQQGLEVLVMSIPNGLDPDEYIAKYGKESFQKLLDDALPLIDYKLAYLERFYKLGQGSEEQNNHSLTKYIASCITLLSQMNDVEQQHYIKVVSQKTGYTVDFLSRKMANNTPIVVNTQAQYSSVHYHVISCMLANTQFTLPVDKPYSDNNIVNSLYDYVYQCHQEGTQPRVDMIYTIAPDQDKALYSALLSMQDKEIGSAELQYYQDCLSQLQLEQYQQSRQSLSLQLKQGDLQDQQYQQILSDIQAIDDKINTLMTDN